MMGAVTIAAIYDGYCTWFPEGLPKAVFMRHMGKCTQYNIIYYYYGCRRRIANGGMETELVAAESLI